MKYRVVVHPRADDQLTEQSRYIARRSPAAARKWFDGFLRALHGLSIRPERCGLASESELAGREVRQLLYGRRAGKRRVLFVIDGDVVRVLAILHAAQSDAPPTHLLDD